MIKKSMHYSRYSKIANELLYLPKMNKRELIDWFLDKQDHGKFVTGYITVKDLIEINDNIESYADLNAIVRRDYNKILKRMEKGEHQKDIAKAYNMNKDAFNRTIKRIEKENVE